MRRIIRWFRSTSDCATKTDLAHATHQILMKASEAVDAINKVADQLTKASREIQDKIASLQQSDPDISPEGQKAVARLQTIGQALDDIVPDNINHTDNPPAIGEIPGSSTE